jgi:NAD(P)-dependent dehydrogenase (short-subunit alcohol dehydrogenase family)
MTKEHSLAGRRVLITGATRGLGAVLVSAFWAAGAHIAAVARSKESLLRLKSALPDAGKREFLPIAADLAGIDAPPRIAKEIIAQWNGLDILINNAGIQGPVGPLETNSWPEWDETLRVDLLAPVQLCRLLVPLLARGGRGRIINLSGGGATAPRPGFSAYATAKAGLVRFSETLAEEVRHNGVTVNCIAPGAMATDMIKGILALGPEKAGIQECQAAEKALAAGEAVLSRAAQLALFLASDEAANISGRLISAQWDPWSRLGAHTESLQNSDIYTLRRIMPKDRGEDWGG